MTKLKRITFSILSVILILVSMCPISAYGAYSDDDFVFHVEMSQPTVDNNHFYLEFLLRAWDDEVGDWWYFPAVYYFVYTPYFENTVSSSIETLEVVTTVSIEGSQFKVNVLNSDAIFGYLSMGRMWNGMYNYYSSAGSNGSITLTQNTNYDVVSWRAYGFTDVESDISADTSFSILYSESGAIYNSLLDVISMMSQLVELDKDIVEKINDILLECTDINSALDSIITIYNQLLTKVDTLISQTDQIEPRLYEMIEILFNIWTSLESWLPAIEANTYQTYLQCLKIVERLDTLIEILQQKGDSEFSEPDTSNLDNYYDVENSLLDNSNADMSNVKVEIDQNAMAVTWDILDRFLNVHPAVIGLFITVLSLGIIALILGR